jgi:hypothetical protein
VRIDNNTITKHDSLATAGEAFAPNSPNESTPQPGAGIVTRTHSNPLLGAGEVGTFSVPSVFADNIVWENRQFYFVVTSPDCTPGDPGCTTVWGLCPELGVFAPALPVLGCGTDPVFDDLAVIGTGCLSPEFSVLTDLGPDASGCSYGDPPGGPATGNLAADPLFIAQYFNGGRSSVIQPEITTPIQAPPAFDEGGNFIRVQHGPLTLFTDDTPNNGDPGVLIGDYHIGSGSPAIDVGADWTHLFPALELDFDLEPRPSGNVDIGADEVQGGKDVGGDYELTNPPAPKNPPASMIGN